MKIILHSGKDGRLYWIHESHHLTDEKHCVCCVVEPNNMFGHTVVKSRSDLTAVLYTEMHNGVIDMGAHRLNAQVEAVNRTA